MSHGCGKFWRPTVSHRSAESRSSSYWLTKEAARVEVHPVRFDDQGNGHLLSEDGEPFGHSAEAFAATGGVSGYRVAVCPPKRRCRTIRGDTNRATPMSKI
jgi:hypothetical protein